VIHLHATDLRPMIKKVRTKCAERYAPGSTKCYSIRRRVLRCITKDSLFAFSRGRLTDEDPEGTGDEVTKDLEGEETADIIKNEDTTG
jgi:hypothetical protein